LHRLLPQNSAWTQPNFSTPSYVRLARVTFDADIATNAAPIQSPKRDCERTSEQEASMSPLTLFIAKLIGLMFLVFSLLMAMNKRAMLAAIDEVVRSRGLMLIGGSFNLAAGLAIVLGHNVWSGGALTVVVTLIGWLVALRGVVWLFTPQEKLVQFYEALHFERKYYVATAITGTLGLYLTVAGFAG
jgi:hypothetical protein